MVNATLIETILRERDNPGHATTRQIRDLYNHRSGEEPIIPHSDQDREFQKLLLQALDNIPMDDTPISYTVKLKECDDTHTPTGKRRSMIKLPKEAKDQSESDDQSSDVEKLPTTNLTNEISKPFSPLFLNNMKKFGVSSDWLSRRSNSLRQSAYSRSSVKSNTSQLDAMIKSASTKPIKSNRKLSFVETSTSSITIENGTDKENVEPVTVVEKKTTAYDLSSEEEEEEEVVVESTSPNSKDFALRIPRVSLEKDEKKDLNASSSSSSLAADDEVQEEKPIVKKRQRKSKPKKEAIKSPEEPSDEEEEKVEDETKATVPKKDKTEQEQTRIDHLKKLLRISGIKTIVKKTELEPLNTNRKKINYLKSLFDAAGFQGNLTIKDCEKFRKKRDTEKELEEIQSKAVQVKGHVKGGRTLRGQARTSPEVEIQSNKRKRQASSEVEDDDDDSSSDEDKPTTKKRRILQMQASPEISDDDE